MAYFWKFTDGTKIPICGGRDLTPYEIYTYKNSVLVASDGTNDYSLFTGIKTDYAGNTLTIIRSSTQYTATIRILAKNRIDGGDEDFVSHARYNLGSRFALSLLYWADYDVSGDGDGILWSLLDKIGFVNSISKNPQFELTWEECYADYPEEYSLNYLVPQMTTVAYMGAYTHPYRYGGHRIPFGCFPNSIINGGDPDPYEEQPTTEGGGGGNRDNTSDPIDIPALPVTSAAITGFVTIYTPSLSQLWDLAAYMWSSDFDLITFKALFNAPMDAIFGLNILPFEVTSGGSRLVVIGNMVSDVTMDTASSQYEEIDCGSITVNEFWGSYLDYAPYTKAELYLPFVGTHPIDIDDIMGKTIQIVYHVDILSGGCIAMVKSGDSVLYNFSGHCSVNAPISGANFDQAVRAAVSTAVSTGMMVATGGTSAAAGTGAKVGNALASAGAASVNNAVSQFKPSIEKSGAIGNAAGLLGIRKPYLILTRPRQAIAEDQNAFYGYPSHIAKTLSTLTGYTEIDSIHLEGIPATQGEYSEIEKLLMEGVIL